MYIMKCNKGLSWWVQLSLMAVVLALPCRALAANSSRGDVNGDGNVNIADVTALIDYLLGGSDGVAWDNADVNRDGALNIADVTSLIDHLLGGYEFPPERELITVNGASFTMIPVEGGSYMMGATPEQGTDGIDREKPVHQVTLSSYYIGETEVTQALWEAVMGDNPSHFIGGQRPVENVSWDDCQVFISTLNELTGRTFRLPTEAEWEFAARGGNASEGYKYAGSDDVTAVAWYSYNDTWDLRGTGAYGTHDVMTRMFNELEIYDMSGNVHEWCQDWYNGYSDEAQIDPVGPATGTHRVYRGGSWYFDEWFCRVSFRNSVVPTYRSYGIGMRLAESITQ